MQGLFVQLDLEERRRATYIKRDKLDRDCEAKRRLDAQEVGLRSRGQEKTVYPILKIGAIAGRCVGVRVPDCLVRDNTISRMKWE